MSTGKRRGRWWGLVALLVALAGCGQAATAGPKVTSPATGTGTPRTAISKGPQVTWQPAVMPPDAGTVAYGPLTVAQSDGDVAYACDPAFPHSAGIVHIWVTRDRGQHWAAGGDIAGMPGAADCWLSVDDNNANVIIATLNTATGGASPEPFNAAAYASFDGGASWRTLSPHQSFSHVASYHGVYFAARTYEASMTSPMIGNLAVSTDQMASWLPIGPDQSFAGSWFWLNPLTGSLLTNDGSSANGVFMRSDDGGTHWNELSLPGWTQTILAVPQSSGQGWTICVAAAAGPTGATTLDHNMLACSTDGGQTWQTRPALNLTNQSPKGFSYPASAFAFAIANDGAVLATVTDSNAVTQLYRLPAGAATWQSLGPLSGIAGCDYYHAPGAGVLWESLVSSPNPYLTASYPG